MSPFANLIMILSYLLGLASVIAVAILAIVPSLEARLHLTTRGGLFFAITLFLCSIASSLVRKAS